MGVLIPGIVAWATLASQVLENVVPCAEASLVDSAHNVAVVENTGLDVLEKRSRPPKIAFTTVFFLAAALATIFLVLQCSRLLGTPIPLRTNLLLGRSLATAGGDLCSVGRAQNQPPGSRFHARLAQDMFLKENGTSVNHGI